LRNALESEVPEVSFAAKKALWRFKYPEVLHALQHALGDKDWSVRTGAGYLRLESIQSMRLRKPAASQK
jgi:HEAT repeat protein